MDRIHICYSSNKLLMFYTYCHYIWRTSLFKIYFLLWAFSWIIMLPGIVLNIYSYITLGWCVMDASYVARYIMWGLYFLVCTTIASCIAYFREIWQWRHDSVQNPRYRYTSFQLLHDYVTFTPEQFTISVVAENGTSAHIFLYYDIYRITISRIGVKMYFTDPNTAFPSPLFIPRQYFSKKDYATMAKWCSISS